MPQAHHHLLKASTTTNHQERSDEWAGLHEHIFNAAWQRWYTFRDTSTRESKFGKVLEGTAPREIYLTRTENSTNVQNLSLIKQALLVFIHLRQIIRV